MIKITKKLVRGEEVGKPNCDFFYLYTGMDTKTRVYAACITLPEQIDNNPKFDKDVRARIRLIIKKKIGMNNSPNHKGK